MLRKVILDTGILVAVLDKSDNYHNWAIQEWAKIAKPLLTCEAVVTESCFVLQDIYGSEDAIMALIERGTVQIDFRFNDEVKVIRELMQRYQSVPMSFADACLVRMSELIGGSSVLTLDSDFYIYRKNRREAIDLMIPDRV